jgi:hypothetical protein
VLGPVARPRERLVSGPEIRTGYGQIGRETLAAIAEELKAAAGEELSPPERVRALARAASSPEIAVRETLAGRETLGAIAQELRLAPRNPLTTKRYGDRISNAPGSMTPSFRRRDSSPEISVAPGPVGRETLAAINDELAQGLDDEPTTLVRSKSAVNAETSAIEVFEMMTFVARGDLSQLGSTPARRDFVEERLMHRLPVDDISQVDRIDVTPWTVKGTVIVRVWCVVPPPAVVAAKRHSG